MKSIRDRRNQSPLPPQIQEALGEFVGAAREGLLALSVGVGLGVVPELMELEVTELSVARGFARYLRTLDETCEVPPTDLLPSRRRQIAPYLYSDEEIAALMAATATIHFPQRGATYRTTVIGLLAVTGLRIGESDRT